MGAKLSVEDAEQEGAKHTEVEARASFAHLLLCFNTLAIGDGAASHCDSLRTFSTHLLLLPHLHTFTIEAAVTIV